MGYTVLTKFPKFVAYIGLLLAVLFWAGNAVLARAVTQDIPPIALSLGRWIVAFIIILPFGLRPVMKQRALYIQRWKQVTWLALLSVALYNCLLYVAAHTTTAVNITLVSSSMPVVTLLLVWLLLKRMPSTLQVAGIVIVFAGLSIIIGGFSLDTWKSLEFRLGDLLMLLATIGWSFYTVQYKQWSMNEFNALGLITVLIGLGSVMIIPGYIFEYSQQGGFSIETSTALIFLYAGVCPSILSFLFWNKGVEVLGPAISAFLSNLMPLFTAVLAFYLLNEALTLQHYVGGGLMFLGLIVSSK